MTREQDQIREVVLRTLGTIAPEADLEHIKPGQRFRDQFDFDSVDFLNFALALQEQLNIQIPEIDYPRLSTLSGCIQYLSQKAASDERG